MKTKISILIIFCLLLGLSACTTEEDEAAALQATIDTLNTSVAQTLTVMTQAVTPTTTPTPATTPTLTATVTQGFASPTATRYTVPTSSGCDSALWVSDVTIPDNTVMTPGQTFTKTWSIKNAGTCEWTTSYKLVFLSGDQMGGTATNLTSSVAAGRADNFSVKLTAPLVKGTYTGYWILQNASGKTFGQSVYTTIVVSTSVTSTPTGTITATPNLTQTIAAQNTAYAAATSYALTASAPTNTPIPPTPTETETTVVTTEPPSGG